MPAPPKWVLMHGTDGTEYVIQVSDVCRLYQSKVNGDRVYVMHCDDNHNLEIDLTSYELLKGILLAI